MCPVSSTRVHSPNASCLPPCSYGSALRALPRRSGGATWDLQLRCSSLPLTLPVCGGDRMPPRFRHAADYEGSPHAKPASPSRGSPGTRTTTATFGDPQPSADVGRPRSQSEEEPAAAYSPAEGMPPPRSGYGREAYDPPIPEPEPETPRQRYGTTPPTREPAPTARRRPLTEQEISSAKAKNKAWAGLSEAEEQRAIRLGWNQQTWDDEQTKGPLAKNWDDLTDEVRVAHRTFRTPVHFLTRD